MRDIKIGTILDGARWTRSCAFAALSTPRGSPERRARLAELTTATGRARVLAQGYQGKMAPELRFAIGVAEVALRHLGERQADPPISGSDESNGKPSKIHPRRAISRRG